MEPNKISPDDPRITAYALQEMEPAEQAGFEQLLAQDAAAREVVEEIRRTAAVLGDALENEPVHATPAPDRPYEKKPGLLLRFPQFYYMVSGLAAACFAVFFVMYERQESLKVRTRLMEISLTGQTAGKMEAKSLPPPPAPASVAPQVDMPVTMAVAPESEQEVKLDAFAVSPAPVGGVNQLAFKRAEAARGNYISAPPNKERQASVKDVAAEANTEAYGYHKDNAFERVADQPLSTFSADVDTASYANVRRFFAQGQRPPADAVRIEELVNYFPYSYAPPTGAAPFAVALEAASAPWAPEHRLVRIGLKGREVSDATRPAANLVFLLDVSGSMDAPNRLPLVKQSLRLLTTKLRPDDQVAIVVYAGASGLALPSTSAAHQAEILDAIDRLQAEGSTNGAAGIQLAYDIAKAHFVTGGVNRVILATDGDFNVGVSSESELVRLVEEKAKSGVFLTVLGFGMGNYKDATLEQLADKGNGNYAYIDSLAEAKKTLVEQAGGTLVTIAKDVKLQVEFNPTTVQAYRLIGYENRLLAKEDFNNDQVDAGEIGAGHTVTALYEIVPVGVALPGETPAVDELKYQRTKPGANETNLEATEDRKLKAENIGRSELLTLKIRYKEPAGEISNKLEFALQDTGARFEDASQDFKFASAVAAFGMELRASPYKGKLTLADVASWGRAGVGSDPGGYRNEFIGLVEKAQHLVQ